MWSTSSVPTSSSVMSRRESSASRSRRSSVDSQDTRSTHDGRRGRHLDHKMDKVLDVLADLRSSIREEFSLVHRNVQELQQSHQDHDRSLATLSSRIDLLEQSNKQSVSSERPAKRRTHEQLPPDTASVPATQPVGSGSALRPRVTLSGFKTKHSVEEYGQVLQELFGKLEGVKLSCKMLYFE